MEPGLPGVGTIIVFFAIERPCANLDNSELAEDFAMQNSGEEV